MLYISGCSESRCWYGVQYQSAISSAHPKRTCQTHCHYFCTRRSNCPTLRKKAYWHQCRPSRRCAQKRCLPMYHCGTASSISRRSSKPVATAAIRVFLSLSKAGSIQTVPLLILEIAATTLPFCENSCP